MIKLYMRDSMTSSRKCKKWLEDQNINHSTINTGIHKLNKEEIKDLLALTENGFDSIIAKRCLYYKNNIEKLGNLTCNEMIDEILEHKELLSTPIILHKDHHKLIASGRQENWEVLLNGL